MEHIRTWLPVLISVGGLIVGYVIFKSSTEHRLTSAENTITEIRNDLRSAQQAITGLDRVDINFNSRIKVLERQPIGEPHDLID